MVLPLPLIARPHASMYRRRLQYYPGGNVNPNRYRYLEQASQISRYQYRVARRRTNYIRNRRGTRNANYWINWRAQRSAYIRNRRLADAYRNTPVGFSYGSQPVFGAPAA